jgi:hypothetical protein
VYATGVKDLAEIKVSAALFALAAETLSGSTDFEKILEASDLLKGQRGTLALVGSSAKLRGLRLDSDVQTALQNTGMVPGNVDPRFVSNEVLAAACGVSKVLEGLNVLWPADALAVMILADAMFAPKQLIQSMRTICYVPDAQTPDDLVECYEGYDDTRTSEYVDVEEWTDVEVLNESLIKVIDGSTESSSG